jgi:predicted dehydrogenase
MIRVGVVGIGKMGISHLSILGAHPEVEIAGVCDQSSYALSVIGKYSGFPTFSSVDAMIAGGNLDALLLATPTQSHASLTRQGAAAGLHVFCEKPFTMDAADSRELAELFRDKGLVGQVGYHYRLVAAFQEVKAILDANLLGKVTHVLAEAYGPVVLKPQGSTWRSKKSEGGGALYDYAAHPLNLLNWYFGDVIRTAGTELGQIFSRQTDDEVYSNLWFADGISGHLSVNWSDESQRKMTTKVSIWGTQGRLYADRQEVQLYLRAGAPGGRGYGPGWNARYTTDLTTPVDFYLRGEEYSAQLDTWIERIKLGQVEGENDFASAASTDQVIQALLRGDVADAPAPAGKAEGRVRTWWAGRRATKAAVLR